MKRIWLAACVLLLMGMSRKVGDLHIPPDQTVPTCVATIKGSVLQMKGEDGQGYTKLCYCVSDGASPPAYLWCSTQFAAGAATTTCAGGSTTVCP